jgi:hypothetical protein
MRRSGAASLRPPRNKGSSIMQARQHSVEQFSRRITADARRPIWQPIGRNSEAPAFVEGGLRFGFSAFRVEAGFPFCAREFRSTNF